MRLAEAKVLEFRARGHHNVRATHKTTLEITKEEDLTPRGDCIIGVGAEISPAEIPEEVKRLMARDDALLVALFCAREVCDAVVGRGSSRLELSDTKKMVFRKSSYVGPETVMIGADKAARDLKRELTSLMSQGEELRVTLIVLPA
ncbi:MAG: DUF371 domain-containing protein [Acidilobaceae archaeon]|nr:DUF371 domain-containing protein [Acidilobaceae archaeon]MCX8165533.1 DUF371 domain-containing protein [Acidilobaceae archaeon]MDW7973960.1 DUF371 domain-containing protein [Sulfolobales archaeon]